MHGKNLPFTLPGVRWVVMHCKLRSLRVLSHGCGCVATLSINWGQLIVRGEEKMQDSLQQLVKDNYWWEAWWFLTIYLNKQRVRSQKSVWPSRTVCVNTSSVMSPLEMRKLSWSAWKSGSDCSPGGYESFNLHCQCTGAWHLPPQPPSPSLSAPVSTAITEMLSSVTF